MREVGRHRDLAAQLGDPRRVLAHEERVEDVHHLDRVAEPADDGALHVRDVSAEALELLRSGDDDRMHIAMMTARSARGHRTPDDGHGLLRAVRGVQGGGPRGRDH